MATPFSLFLGDLQTYRSGILSTKSLCIHHGKAAWVLYIDATCINYDGNVFDATLLAMVAALKNSMFKGRHIAVIPTDNPLSEVAKSDV